jgi:2,4-dienoyl-CoA reductase (NADPH2)
MVRYKWKWSATPAPKALATFKRPNHTIPADVERTIDEFSRCAELAKAAGYDGVEVMGSEGMPPLTQNLGVR